VVVRSGQELESGAGRARDQAAQQLEDKRLGATARAAGQNRGDIDGNLQVNTSATGHGRRRLG
jgi:hypothetical protein